MNRRPFTTARTMHSIACVLNRLDSAKDTASLIEAANRAVDFDNTMNKAHRETFAEFTEKQPCYA